ncbi:hypothetical protein H5410_023195 [Solanum commersonii]|uniref:Uncharacterized protein n=1 Tax=Solanum commersonii TaxID=4109 RepID=A0A9J5ZGV5_SOLCO|nr:hypothetical protein H5410_023195 [Solanum commersonii]
MKPSSAQIMSLRESLSNLKRVISLLLHICRKSNKSAKTLAFGIRFQWMSFSFMLFTDFQIPTLTLSPQELSRARNSEVTFEELHEAFDFERNLIRHFPLPRNHKFCAKPLLYNNRLYQSCFTPRNNLNPTNRLAPIILVLNFTGQNTNRTALVTCQLHGQALGHHAVKQC